MNHDPAYILCGGQSSRMGEDKARIDIAGTALVQRVAQQLAALSQHVYLVAQSAGAYSDLGLTTLGDRIPNLGPLGGLATALHHRVETMGAGWLILTACDTLVRVPHDLRTLCVEVILHGKSALAIASRDDYWHPMPGRYHSDLLPLVERLLAEDVRAFQALLNHEDAHAYAITGVDAQMLQSINLNTPRDIEAARKLFAHG